MLAVASEMKLPSAKELKSLAKACRSAGIARFKTPDFEIDLTPYAPATPTRTRKRATQLSDNIESDAPSDEALLFWSTPSDDDDGIEGII